MILTMDTNIIFVFDLRKLMCTLMHLTVVHKIVNHSIIGIGYLLKIILNLVSKNMN